MARVANSGESSAAAVAKWRGGRGWVATAPAASASSSRRLYHFPALSRFLSRCVSQWPRRASLGMRGVLTRRLGWQSERDCRPARGKHAASTRQARGWSTRKISFAGRKARSKREKQLRVGISCCFTRLAAFARLRPLGGAGRGRGGHGTHPSQGQARPGKAGNPTRLAALKRLN